MGRPIFRTPFGRPGQATARPSFAGPDAILGAALRLWLRGGVGITGSPVDSWSDSAGVCAAFTGVTTARPSIGTQNGITVPVWDGSNDYLASTSIWSDISTATAWEITAVLAVTAAPADGVYTTGAGILTESIGAHGLIINQSGIRAYGYDAAVQTTNYVSCPQDGARRIVGGRLDAGFVYARVGTTTSAGVACGTETLRSNPLRAGARYDATIPITGSICDLIVANRALTTAERANLDRYLTARWGL